MFDKDCPVPESFRSMLWNILSLSVLFFFTFIARFIFSPLMPVIESELGITHSQAGSLFLMISLGLFAGQVFSGFLSSRVNHRVALALATLGTGAALMSINLTSSFWILRTIMVFLGMAAGLHMPSAMATITAMVDRKEWGKAMAVHQAAPPLSLVLGPLLIIWLLDPLSWRDILTVIGGIAIVIGLLFLSFGRCGEFPGDPPRPALLKTLISRLSFWVMVVMFALAMSGTIGIYTMLPLFLVNERGFDADQASSLLGLSRVAGLFMPFVAGWLTSRLGEKRVIFLIMILSGLSTIMLGILSGMVLISIIFIQPAILGCYFTAGFAALARIVQPHLRSIAASFTTPAAFLIGGGLFPAVLGYMGQAYSFGLGITLTGVCMILFSPLVLFLRLIEKMEEGC
jgi:NNP family nitrate/nitrite transporter-like MFS transporter